MISFFTYIAVLFSFLPFFGFFIGLITAGILYYFKRGSWRIQIAIAVLGMIFNLVGLTYYLSEVYKIYQAVNELNASAPTMVEEGVRFNGGNIENRNITLYFTMTEMEYSEYDLNKIEQEFVPTQRKEICERYSSRAHYGLYYSVIYLYTDKNGREIARVKTNSDICKETF